MVLTRRSLLLAASGSLLASGADAAAITEKYGASYLDIFPVSGRPAPVVVYVHGGAWKYGNRRSVHAKPGFFNGLGCVFVSVGYRLVPNVDVSTQRDDVAAAVAWVRSNIGRFGGEPERILLMGHSAGAHLASLVALQQGRDAVRCLISNDTRAYDLGAMIPSSRGFAGRVYEEVFPNEEKWASLSPIAYADRHPAPDCLIMWSQGSGRRYWSARFVESLRGKGAAVDVFDGAGLSHRQINRSMGTGEFPDLDLAVSRFVDERLR